MLIDFEVDAVAGRLHDRFCQCGKIECYRRFAERLQSLCEDLDAEWMAEQEMAEGR